MPRLLAWLQAVAPEDLSPALLAANAVLGAIMLGAIALGGVGWTQGLARLLRGEPLLEFEPRRRVPWGLIDLIGLLAFLTAALLLGSMVLQELKLVQRPEPGEPLREGATWLLMADAIAKLSALAAVVVFIRLRQPLTWRDLGFSSAQVPFDLAIGGLAFCMLAPLVFAIQFVLVQWWPSSHPLIEMLQKSPSPWMFGLTCFSAVIIAPLSEEFVFRVLLQGWLEKIASGKDDVETLIVGGYRERVSDAPLLTDNEESANQAMLPPADTNHPYASPQVTHPHAEPTNLIGSAPAGSPAIQFRQDKLWFLPILFSSLIFALLHWSHGPDWVPLTVLALGLGYLYQRTHRALPSMFVHFLLNGFSMLGVALQVFLMPAK